MSRYENIDTRAGENIDLHDAIAWGPNGRASDVPITERGPSPFADEADASADPPRGGEGVNAPVFPNPDVVQLKRFADVLFKHAEPKGFVSLRAFPHKENSPTAFVEPITLDDPQFCEVVTERARQAATWHEPAVFCPPVATFKSTKSAAEDNILEGVTLAGELDETPDAARAKLTEWLGEPTLAMQSGGEWTNPETGEVEPRLHLHWRLKAPARTSEEIKQLKEARKLLVELVGGDPTAAPVCHPLRWAGSWHTKGKPRLATIISESENEIDLTEALGVLREEAGASLFGSHDQQGAKEKRAADPQDVLRALEVIPNENLKWKDWNHIGMATWGATGGSDEGGKFFANWSAKASKNDPEATAARWQHYHTSPPTRLGFGTLVYLARQYSPGWMPKGDAPEPSADPVDLWGKFDPPSLPRGLLPDILERFAVEQGQDMGADIAGVAVSALAVCAAAIPDKIKLQVKRHNTGWLEAARIWVAPIGLPSTKKSPIMAAAVRPLRKIDSELARQYALALSEYNKLPKEEKLLTNPPKHVRVMLQDTTIEAAQEVLKDSPDGVLCFQDELSGWFGSMEKYSSGKGGAKDRAFWLEAFNGGQYSVNRIGRGSSYIDPLSICLLGGIQPEPIRKIAGESVDDGLLQRILPVILRPAVQSRDEEPSSAASEYNALIGRLHHLDNPFFGGGAGLDFNATGTLRFDEGAQAYRDELERKHLDLLSIESINRKLAAHIGKYDGIFARLCVIWHCVESEQGKLNRVIPEATARRVGAFLHGFLLPHAFAFYINVLGFSDNHDRLANVAGYILAHKLERLTNRDIQKGDRAMRNLEDKDIDSVFSQLSALGWINQVPGPYPKSKPHWIVNPVVHVKFAERGKAEAGRRARDREMIAAILGKGGSA